MYGLKQFARKDLDSSRDPGVSAPNVHAPHYAAAGGSRPSSSSGARSTIRAFSAAARYAIYHLIDKQGAFHHFIPDGACRPSSVCRRYRPRGAIAKRLPCCRVIAVASSPAAGNGRMDRGRESRAVERPGTQGRRGAGCCAWLQAGTRRRGLSRSSAARPPSPSSASSRRCGTSIAPTNPRGSICASYRRKALKSSRVQARTPV